MKFTLSWLKEYLDSDATVSEICETLTMIGLEVEFVEEPFKLLNEFIVAQVISTKRHPNAEKLRICEVYDGVETLQIVCGASNVRDGIKVVLAHCGVLIPSNSLIIRKISVRGIESHGMLCSYQELCLNNNDSNDGIIELPLDATIGDKSTKYLVKDDPVIDIKVTPNRADCLGVYGVARDLSAANIGNLRSLVIEEVKSQISCPIKISVEIPNTYFSGRYFKNVKNCISPNWLQSRLKSIGLTPISALVDITNYIMYSFSRPMHVYDADILDGNISVCYAKNGEKFTGLNDKQYSLVESDIIISDKKRVISLAGIIGDKKTACNLDTRNILLEVALFDSGSISKSGRRHKIETDARHRFERYIDPKFVNDAMNIASNMILEICGGEVSDIIVSGSNNFDNFDIILTIEDFYRLSGITLSVDNICDIFRKLHFQFSVIGEIITVKRPSWRSDILIKEDLIEEVLRIYGYDKIPAIIPRKVANVFGTCLNYEQNNTNFARRNLSSRGLYEVITWSFMSSKLASYFVELNDNLLIINPISSELDYMRPTIIPNLLSAVRLNGLRKMTNVRIFEIGPVFYANNKQEITIASIRSGKDTERNIYSQVRVVDVFDAKADLYACIREFGFDSSKLQIDTNDIPQWFHPYRSAVVKLGKTVIGYFGEIHPLVIQSMDISTIAVGFEFFINRMPLQSLKNGKLGKDYSNYQSVERDFAFIVPSDVAFARIERSVKSVDRKLIKDCKIFDLYTGEPLEKDKKSIAVTVIMQSNDKTFTNEEIDLLSTKIIESVKQETHAILRSS